MSKMARGTFRPMATVVGESHQQKDETAKRRNYKGDTSVRDNKDADISEDENCKVYINRLPYNLTYEQLLGAIRNCGKVKACHINNGNAREDILASVQGSDQQSAQPSPQPPTRRLIQRSPWLSAQSSTPRPTNRTDRRAAQAAASRSTPRPEARFSSPTIQLANWRSGSGQPSPREPSREPVGTTVEGDATRGYLTSDATVTFFNRQSAEALVAQNGRFRIGDTTAIIPQIRWNRQKVAPENDEGKSRVLRVTASETVVNKQFLSEYFSSKLTYNLEKVETIWKKNGMAQMDWYFSGWAPQAVGAKRALEIEYPDVMRNMLGVKVQVRPDPCAEN